MRVHLFPLSLHLVLPVLAFLLGVLAVSSPIMVLVVAAALWVLALGWVVRSLVGSSTLTSYTAAAACLSVLGGCYGFCTGIFVGREGTAPMAAWLLAFSAGLAAGLLARQQARHTAGLIAAARAVESRAAAESLPSVSLV